MLLSLRLLASQTGKRQKKVGLRHDLGGKIHLQYMGGFASHGYFFPLLIQVSRGALFMPSLLKVGWQDTDFYAGLYENRLSIKVFLLLSTMFFHLCASC